MNPTDWVARSRAAIWHPCTQMKHHETWPLVPIARGEGAWLVGMNGERYLDAVSSWWTNLFGHANPYINSAIAQQLATLPHAMLAGFTHEPAIRLAERLGAYTGLSHAFLASDGASAVEIALKMSFHYWCNTGRPQKRTFVSLDGGYHGETLGALSVTDVPLFRDAYGPLTRSNLLAPCPAPSADAMRGTDGCCEACVAPAIDALEALFEQRGDDIAALIVEPLVQGANGMRMYHPTYLTRARQLCDVFNVHLIADEIMTGFGRTGTMFAYLQAGIRPDFVTLSKGLTGGYLPLSAVLTTGDVYSAFYDDDTARGFLHSHSYTGNALACSAANAVLDLFEHGSTLANNRLQTQRFNEIIAPIVGHPRISGLRNLGMIWAFEVTGADVAFSRRLFSAGLARGVLLRPIGNTVYFMPPYVVDAAEFQFLVDSTLTAIDACD